MRTSMMYRYAKIERNSADNNFDTANSFFGFKQRFSRCSARFGSYSTGKNNSHHPYSLYAREDSQNAERADKTSYKQ